MTMMISAPPLATKATAPCGRPFSLVDDQATIDGWLTTTSTIHHTFIAARSTTNLPRKKCGAAALYS
jgi:hypothetical protein